MNVDSSKQRTAREVFEEVCDVPVDDRIRRLNELCANDEILRRDVEELLAIDESNGTSPLDLVAEVINETGSSFANILEHPDSLIGPYKIREKLAEGGMGIVYVAEQSQPVRRKVALKIIKPGMSTKDVNARFEAERQALAMMDHPNIARVIDGGVTESQLPFFVMELVQGLPITDYCDQCQLNANQRLTLFVKVCRAVQHAHHKGIIHRDLKPSNVLVAEIDGEAVPKVIDFGIAKAVNQKLSDDTIYTHFSQMVGTPLYMSPEQAGLGVVDVDTRSDVYSLGVLLYELLTGATPFDIDTLKNSGFDEMRRIIREEEPPRPSRHVSTMCAADLSTLANRHSSDSKTYSASLRGELDWIVMKCLEKDRNRRYESASSLGGDLECYLDGRSVQAVPPSIGYQLRKFATRHKTVLATTAMIAVALLVGIATSLWYASSARREAIAAEDARRLADERLKESQAARLDADSNYEVALRTVESMLLGLVDDQVARVPVSSRNRLLTDARRLFDQLLQYNSQDTKALLQRARVNAYLLDPGQAMADYEQVLKLSPENAEAHADLARFLGNNLDVHYVRPAAALEHARQAVGLAPGNAMHQVTLAFLLREQNPQKALEILDKAVQLDPQSAEAFVRRGVIRWDQGDREAALNDVDRSLQLNPDFAFAVRFKAEMLAELGQIDEALDAYTRAISLDPYSPQAYLGRASVHWRLGDPEGAKQDIDVAQYLAPMYSVSDKQSVQLRTQQGQFREALEAINRQISARPKNLWLRERRAEILLRMQRYAEALPGFDKFLAQHPDEYFVYKRRAVARFHLGEVDAALDDLERALDLAPTDSSTIRWIAPRKFLTSATPEQRTRLLRLADRAVDVAEPGILRAAALTDRATIRFSWNEMEQAVADCNEALVEYPATAPAWYHNGVAELSKGNSEKYQQICAARLPALASLDGAGAWPDYGCWTYAIAPNSVPDVELLVQHAERFLEYAMQSDRWWQSTGDIEAVWLRQQILGALLYRSGKTDEALQRLRLAEVQYNQASSWPPYARFFLSMIYSNSGQIEEARRWLTLAANWSENALRDDSQTHWHHRATLKLLLGEAKTVLAEAVNRDSNPTDE